MRSSCADGVGALVQRALGVSAAIGVTAAAPLLLPLHADSKSLTTSPALEPFLPAPSSGVDVMGFLRTNGLDSLVWPFEGSGLLLYCPAVFVFLGLVGLCVRPTHEDAFRRRIIALVVLAISLFVETLILNNASFLRRVGRRRHRNAVGSFASISISSPICYS